jgi:hypothetical protein
MTVTVVTPLVFARISLHDGLSDASLVIVTTMDGFEIFRYRYGA